MLIPGIKATTATTGTGTVTLSSVTGYPLPLDVIASGEWLEYVIVDGNNKEWGYTKIGAGNTASRDIKVSKYDGGTWSWYPATGISLSGSAEFSCEMIDGGRGNHISHFRDLNADSSKYGVLGMTGNIGVLGGSASMGNNIFKGYAFEVAEFMKLDELGFIVATAFASTECRVGLYRVRPFGSDAAATLVVETGALATTTTGLKTAAVSALLTPGNYMAVVASNGGPTLRSFTAGAQSPFCIDGSNVLYSTMNRTSGLTYGAMPATLDLSAWTYNTNQSFAALFRRA